MNTKGIIDWIALILVVIGGLNWGLYAFGTNLVSMLFGTTIVATLVYVLVALSALYMLFMKFKK